MTPELKPCPFCGAVPSRYNDLWVTHDSDSECPTSESTSTVAAWNRRTPDLTEALARLKALEEAVRKYSTMDNVTHWPKAIRWADEIAAIRKELERGA